MNDPQHLLFAPNLTGRLHVGNAMVLWLVAREAKERGIPFIIRLDDRYELAERKSEEKEWETQHTLNSALKLLEIQPLRVIWYSQRQERYLKVAGRLLAAGLVRELKPGTIDLYDANYIEDLIHGRIRTYSSNIVRAGEAYSTLAQAVDLWEFNVPLVIDGNELQNDCVADLHVWDLIARSYRTTGEARPKTALVPMIADANGNVLHKSKGPNDLYDFERWATNYNTTADIRQALERLILKDGTSFSWDNVRAVQQIDVSPMGEQVRVHDFFELGPFCRHD